MSNTKHALKGGRAAYMPVCPLIQERNAQGWHDVMACTGKRAEREVASGGEGWMEGGSTAHQCAVMRGETRGHQGWQTC
eukprot:1161762-Pelagomonas_calceolata.AAC.7